MWQAISQVHLRVQDQWPPNSPFLQNLADRLSGLAEDVCNLLLAEACVMEKPVDGSWARLSQVGVLHKQTLRVDRDQCRQLPVHGLEDLRNFVFRHLPFLITDL